MEEDEEAAEGDAEDTCPWCGEGWCNRYCFECGWNGQDEGGEA
jgi:hypothetical protein